MGRFLLVCTLVADLLGLTVSYWMGEVVFPWIGSLLPPVIRPHFALLVLPLTHLLNLFPILHGFSAMLPSHPGVFWMVLYLGAHGHSLARHFYRRYHESDLARPQPGSPGGKKWELIRRRSEEYQEALKRFDPLIQLSMPSFRFFTRKESDQRRELEWRGNLLIIDAALLTSDRINDLRPALAHQLAYYNSEDVWYRIFLDCYPDRFSLFQLVTGIGLWLPTLIKCFLWPTLYWRKRVFVADYFAFLCGQGINLHRQLAAQEVKTKPRSFWSPEPLIEARIEHLEALLSTEYVWQEEHGLLPPT